MVSVALQLFAIGSLLIRVASESVTSQCQDDDSVGLIQHRATQAKVPSPSVPCADLQCYFIFGYGSLMKQASRVKSTCGLGSFTSSQLDTLLGVLGLSESNMELYSGIDPVVLKCVIEVLNTTMHPVEVEGVRRGWYSRGGLRAETVGLHVDGWEHQALDIAPTYLGAYNDSGAHIYAVVYAVTENELKETDRREEASEYTASWLPNQKVRMLGKDSGLPPNAQVRWYPQTANQIKRPTRQFPICQSYVDLFVSGAQELERSSGIPDFALTVLQTTYGWSKFWVNDRSIPMRPFANEGSANNVTDALLNEACQNEAQSGSQENGMKQRLTVDIIKSIRFPG